MQYRCDKTGTNLSVLGYGCMRFPKKGGRIDLDAVTKQIGEAVKLGVNYFDTAYVYGGSEAALGEALCRLGCRDQVYIADKLPQYLIKSKAGTERCFQEQLSRLGTDHIDFYLTHMLPDLAAWQKLCGLGVREWIEEKKAAGAIGRIGFSFHGDTAAFLELLKIIFCKIQDERGVTAPTFYITPTERHDAKGKALCRKRITRLFEAVKGSYENIFKKDEHIELNDDVLAYIVGQLQMFSLLESDVDIKGHAYETIVGSNLRGDKGQFFTPRNMCSMMVRMVDPSEDDYILDPAMGTCGFLVTAMNYVIKRVERSVEKSGRSDKAKLKILEDRKGDFLKHIVGIDFDPILVRASKMNMVMNNDGAGQLFHANSLEPFSAFSPELRKALRLDLKDVKGNAALAEGHGVTVIVTNPPFGSKIPIEDPAILSTFDFGHSWSYDEVEMEWVMEDKLVSRPPEILFIERCVKLLEPGKGVAAIVIPNGILGNPSLGFVRQWLFRKTRILASVDMHPDMFQPNVGVQTSVLMVRRLDASEEAWFASGSILDYQIFMAICDHVGHDKRGVTTYVRDDNGYPIVREQTTAVTGIVASDEESEHASMERVVDDDTMKIAEAFVEWRRDQ